MTPKEFLSMPHTLSLAPDGSLRLGLPTGRTLDFRPIPESLALIHRILMADERGGAYEERYPTQHLVNKWLAENRVTRPMPEHIRPLLDIDIDL